MAGDLDTLNAISIPYEMCEHGHGLHEEDPT